MVLRRPSGLMDRLPVLTLLAYSLMSRYSGFLYQTSHEGIRMVAGLGIRMFKAQLSLKNCALLAVVCLEWSPGRKRKKKQSTGKKRDGVKICMETVVHQPWLDEDSQVPESSEVESGT